jgi:hypothetical protein
MGVKAGLSSDRNSKPAFATRQVERYVVPNGRQQQEDGTTGVITVP